MGMASKNEAKIRTVLFLLEKKRDQKIVDALAWALQRLSDDEFRELKERI